MTSFISLMEADDEKYLPLPLTKRKTLWTVSDGRINRLKPSDTGGYEENIEPPTVREPKADRK